MDKITREMCNQIRDAFYQEKIIVENDARVTSSDNKQTYGKQDEVWKTMTKAIKEQPIFSNMPMEFFELDWFPTTQKAQWSGTINGINWTTYYGNEGKGFYVTSDNAEMTPEISKALLKLNLYFDTKWAEAVQQAIDNKDFSNKRN